MRIHHARNWFLLRTNIACEIWVLRTHQFPHRRIQFIYRNSNFDENELTQTTFIKVMTTQMSMDDARVSADWDVWSANLKKLLGGLKSNQFIQLWT